MWGGGGEHQSLVITIHRAPAPLLCTQCGYSVPCRRPSPTVPRSPGRNYRDRLEYLTVSGKKEVSSFSKGESPFYPLLSFICIVQ